MFPSAARFNLLDSMLHASIAGIDAEIDQRLKGGQSRRPWLPLVLAPMGTVRRETGSSGPLAVLALQGKHKVQQATPPIPEEAAESVKEDVQWTKTRAQQGRS